MVLSFSFDSWNNNTFTRQNDFSPELMLYAVLLSNTPLVPFGPPKPHLVYHLARSRCNAFIQLLAHYGPSGEAICNIALRHHQHYRGRHDGEHD